MFYENLKTNQNNNTNNFYHELASPYLEEADTLKKYIHKIKQEISFNPSNFDYPSYRRISMLNGIYIDMRSLGEFLEHRSEIH